ncbi:MAG: hypothetical protein OXE53_09035 [Deltaproteobacteria bacterium]|nr:hypothetical protein [Deltaproteobacteria bacterium]
MKESIRHRVRDFIAEKGEPSIPEIRTASGLTVGQVINVINALRHVEGLNVVNVEAGTRRFRMEPGWWVSRSRGKVFKTTRDEWELLDRIGRRVNGPRHVTTVEARREVIEIVERLVEQRMIESAGYVQRRPNPVLRVRLTDRGWTLFTATLDEESLEPRPGPR